MVRFKNDTPTIEQVFQYTWRNKLTHTRFEYANRDVLPSRIKIQNRKVYSVDALKKESKDAPRECIAISSTSAPQYYPYTAVKGKKSKKQMKIKHTYSVTMIIQPTSDGSYNYHSSKIIWRIGSYQKPMKPSQKFVKTIYSETREKLRKRFERKYKTKKEADEAVKKECEKIRKNAKYLNVGDYLAQEKGIYLDAYYRNYNVQQKFNCLYGPLSGAVKPYKGIIFPFFSKHCLAIISWCLKKGILKY